MWKPGKAAVDGVEIDAMIDYYPARDIETGNYQPAVLEWPLAVALNSEVKIAGITWYAGPCGACARMWHVPLMAEPIKIHVPAPPAAPTRRKAK